MKAKSSSFVDRPADSAHRSDFMAELRKFKQYLDQAGREIDVDFDVRDCKWSHVIELLQKADDAVAKRVERDKTYL